MKLDQKESRLRSPVHWYLLWDQHQDSLIVDAAEPCFVRSYTTIFNRRLHEIPDESPNTESDKDGDSRRPA